MSEHRCRTCHASWTEGRWSWACDECGGGALSVPCGLCLGRCGARWQRAVMDSNDSGRAHFLGGCAEGRPGEEVLREALDATRTLLQLAVPVEALRAALEPHACEEAWRTEPDGPVALRVLRDQLLTRGVDVAPRVLAGMVFLTSQRRRR